MWQVVGRFGEVSSARRANSIPVSDWHRGKCGIGFRSADPAGRAHRLPGDCVLQKRDL